MTNLAVVPPSAGGRRVLMVSPAGQGGTLQYAHNLCIALAEQGHQVVLATAIDCEMAPFPRAYQLMGVFDRFKPHIGPLLRFIRLVREMQPEIVHLQGAQRPEFYWLLLGVLKRLCKAKFVWTPQDVISNSDKPWHGWMQLRNYRAMRHVFLNAKQNEGPVRELFHVPANRITVLPIPDLVAFARQGLERSMPPEWQADEAPLILCFGLIEPRKGIGQLIEAFDLIAARTNARLLIMGKPLIGTEDFKSALAELGLPPDRAMIIDRYASFEEMNALFEAAHVVTLPYVSGWNSGVLASAYGYGVPVVATRVGGFDEVVTDGETGLLIAPNDTSALADALVKIVEDDTLHAHLSKGAAKAGHEASWEAVAVQTADVYDKILA